MQHLFASLLLVCFGGMLRAQDCPLNDLGVITSPGQLITATDQFTDAQGWVHFFNCDEGKIILSIQPQGNDIGSIADGLVITSGLTLDYGTTGLDLSGADYIDDDLWIVMNRYWRIQNAPDPGGEVLLRYYFDDVDVSDVADGVSSTGIVVDEPSDLFMYTVSEASLHPFSSSVQGNGGVFTLFDMVPGGSAPDWTAGTFNDFNYGQFAVETLQISGSGGLLIFMDSPGEVSITGTIENRDDQGIQGVTVDCGSGQFATTNGAGAYVCAPLPANQDYTITPDFNEFDAEGISVLDLVGIARYNAATPDAPTDPYAIIAADADDSESINNADLVLIQNLVLREANQLPQEFWQFVPTNYTFPDPTDPFDPEFPGSITVNEIQMSETDRDFVGIRTGDVWQEDDFPNDPPINLDPTFFLPELITCGAGQMVTVELQVEDFANVHGFQFTVEFDPNVLNFQGVQNFGLTNFTADNVGTTLAGNGQLTFVWFTPDITADNVLMDGTTIVELDFVVNGGDGTNTVLALTGTRTPVQILRENLSQANAGYVLGSVQVSNDSPITLSSSQIEAASCAGETDGSISVAAANGAGNYTYTWSDGGTGATRDDLAPGDYGLTVTDGFNCPFDAGTFTIGGPAPIDISGLSVNQVSCPGETDGSIQLTTIGGTAPYGFQWSDGATTEDRTGLADGTYALTITDEQGCTTERDFLIENPGEVFVSVSVTDATAADANDGAILISDMFGGTPPYVYSWNNGASGPELTGLAPDNYVVTITDAEGCENVFGYVVGIVSSTANPELAAFGLELQPNPVRTGAVAFLQMDNPTTQNVQMKMFDMNSRQIRDRRFVLPRGRTKHYFVAPNASGTYLLQLLTASGAVKSLRIAVVN